MQYLDNATNRPLFGSLADTSDADDETDASSLPAMTHQEEVIADYRTGGLSLTAHPLVFERPRLMTGGVACIATATTAPEGRRVRIAGIVLVRQRPATAKGMIFLTIEDETGSANIVVRPDIWKAADHAARRTAVLMVEGRIQRRGEVVHVVATRLATMLGSTVPHAHDDDSPTVSSLPSPALAALPRMSRDFC
jgi:error-prone DNA polymerase